MSKIKGAKVRIVIEPTITELYVTFPTVEDFNLTSGKFDIELTPIQETTETKNTTEVEQVNLKPELQSDRESLEPIKEEG